VGVQNNMVLETSSRGFTFEYEGEFGGTPTTLEENQYSWNPTTGIDDSSETNDDAATIQDRPLMRPTPKGPPKRPEVDTTNRGFGSDDLGEFGSAGGLGSRPREYNTYVDDSASMEVTVPSAAEFATRDLDPLGFLKDAGKFILERAKEGINTPVVDTIETKDNVSEVANEYMPFPINPLVDIVYKEIGREPGDFKFKNAFDQLKNIFTYRPPNKDKNIENVLDEAFPDIMVYPNYFSGEIPLVSSRDLISEPISTNWDNFFEFINPENVAANFTPVPTNVPINIKQFESLQTPIKNSSYYDKLIAKEEDKGVFDMDLDKIFDYIDKRKIARANETIDVELGFGLPPDTSGIKYDERRGVLYDADQLSATTARKVNALLGSESFIKETAKYYGYNSGVPYGLDMPQRIRLGDLPPLSDDLDPVTGKYIGGKETSGATFLTNDGYVIWSEKEGLNAELAKETLLNTLFGEDTVEMVRSVANLLALAAQRKEDYAKLQEQLGPNVDLGLVMENLDAQKQKVNLQGLY